MTVGLELSPQVCLHPSVIERFCVFARSGAPPSQRRCLRSDLRFVALRAVPEVAQGPLPAPLARDRAKGPYTQAEIEGYFALAAAQATEERCQHLVALLCLGLGAGLSGSDLRYVRGNHVMERSGGVVVVVEGPRARVVPVLRRYHEALLAAAAFAEERFICGGESPWRRNVTAPLTKRLHGGADLARLEVGRLRSTWLAHQLEALGLRALFQGAGISCSQRLGDLATRLAPLSEEDLVEALGGRIV
jgi:integrase